jgi:hypothetical protein
MSMLHWAVPEGTTRERERELGESYDAANKVGAVRKGSDHAKAQ